MTHNMVQRDIGERIHRLIAEVVHSGRSDVTECALELLAASPVKGVLRASVRCQLVSATVVYLQRFMPLGAELVDVELPLEHSVADLVWRRDGRVWIDEVKTGLVDHTDEALLAQVRSHTTGGEVLETFCGTRLVAIARPRRSAWVPVGGDGRLEALPSWLEVR